MVDDAALTLQHGQFGVSERLLRYRFMTPVLLFKSENYRRYQVMDEAGQRAERDRLLVSNLLTAMRGLDVTFPERLYATFTQIKTQTCHYKNQDLLGVIGEFICNAIIPDGLALGHAVSHGFGWIKTA